MNTLWANKEKSVNSTGEGLEPFTEDAALGWSGRTDEYDCRSLGEVSLQANGQFIRANVWNLFECEIWVLRKYSQSKIVHWGWPSGKLERRKWGEQTIKKSARHCKESEGL